MFDLIEKELEFPVRARNAKSKAETERMGVIMDAVDSYRVSSTSSFGTYYDVEFYVKNGRLYVDCECTAGRNEFPCKHIYAAKARRDQIRPQSLPDFAEASVTFRITPRAVIVNGFTTDSFATRTRIDHSRTVSDGAQVLKDLQRLIRNMR